MVLFEIVLKGLLLVILLGVTEIATADSIFLLGAVSKVVVPQQKHVTSEIQNPEADDNNNMIHVQLLARQILRNLGDLAALRVNGFAACVFLAHLTMPHQDIKTMSCKTWQPSLQMPFGTMMDIVFA